MKTRDILLILCTILLVFSGCREITVTTKVHRNGSFTRIIRITGDSSSVFKGDLPYPVDSTWDRVAMKDTSRDKKQGDDYILTYTKTFHTSEELNAELTADTSWRKRLDRQVTVTRCFGFYYSYLTFKEVFPPLNPFTCLPYEKYLTPDDLLWLKGQKNIISRSDSIHFDEVEKKALEFLAASVTAELEKILEEGIVRLNDPDLSVDEVSRFHDSISCYVEKWEFDTPEKFIVAFRNWTGNPAVDRLQDKEPGLFDDFLKKIRFFDSLLMMETYPETVEMPGLITETNSIMLKGNQVSWEVQPLSLLFGDYVLLVESRVVNNWAFVLTGLILLLLIVVLIVKSMK